MYVGELARPQPELPPRVRAKLGAARRTKSWLMARTRSARGMPDERARISAYHDAQKTNHVILVASGDQTMHLLLRHWLAIVQGTV